MFYISLDVGLCFSYLGFVLLQSEIGSCFSSIQKKNSAISLNIIFAIIYILSIEIPIIHMLELLILVSHSSHLLVLLFCILGSNVKSIPIY